MTSSCASTARGRAVSALVAALFVGLAGCGPSGSAPAPGASGTPGPESVSANGTHTGQTSYQIAPPARTIQLNGTSGRVTVSAQDGPMTVTETVTYTDDRPATSHDVVAGVLSLTDRGCPGQRPVNGQCEVDWDIHAPPATTLQLNTASGGIAVTGSFGRLNAQTESGDVRGRGLTGEAVTAQTESGTVDLSFDQPPAQLRVGTESGDVTVGVPAGPTYTVEADTQSGSRDVTVGQDGSGAHRIQARTQSGDIHIDNG